MELVKYHNDFNNLSLKGFGEKELDLLFSICFKLRDEGIEEINLTFSELKELSKYNDRHLGKFVKDLDNVYKKLIGLNFKYEDEKKITRFVLFKAYTIYKDEKIVTIKINEDFKYILNELTGNYTKFELAQFTSLRSSYTKIIFRLLKQFFSTGWREFFYSEFREILSIPNSYKPSDIDKQILKPSIEDLKEYFLNIKIIKIKNGRSLHKIRFEWDIVKIIQPEKEKKDKEIEKTTKEINTDNIIKKQSEDIELGQIINKEIDENYNKYLQLSEQRKIEIEEKVYEKYLEKSNSKDSKIIRGIFEKSKKSLIVEEYQEYIKKNEILEKSEPIPAKTLEEEPTQILENPVGWEEKIFVIYPQTELEIEAKKIIKTILPFIEDEFIDEDIDYVRSTLRRQKRYKELEKLDIFLEMKQTSAVNTNDIYKDEKCLGLSAFGKDYIENYIKEHKLEHLLVSEKTNKEIKGSARESRLIKLYKNDFYKENK
jgi:plasmid replication initiation protein